MNTFLLTAILIELGKKAELKVVANDLPTFLAAAPAPEAAGFFNIKDFEGNPHLSLLKIKFEYADTESVSDEGVLATGFEAPELALTIQFDDYTLDETGLSLLLNGLTILGISLTDSYTDDKTELFGNAVINSLINKNLEVQVTIQSDAPFIAVLTDDTEGIEFGSEIHTAQLDFKDCQSHNSPVRVTSEAKYVDVDFDTLNFKKDGLSFSFKGEQVLDIKIHGVEEEKDPQDDPVVILFDLLKDHDE